MANLNEKQKRFVQEYMVDLNATQAAKRAGYSEKTAYSMGQRLLKKVEIQAALQKAKIDRQKRVEITADRVLEELAAIAFANGTDYATVNRNGLVRIIPTSDLSDEQRKAVASIKEGQYGTEVKTFDKLRALEMLGKHLGMFDNHGASTDPEENNIFEVIEQSTREELDTSEIPEIEPPAKSGHDLVE